MPRTNLERVAQSISEFEGFTVRLEPSNGKAPRLAPYEWARIARNSHTVGDWLRRRFEPYYPGARATVLLANGKTAPPAMKLATVRASYVPVRVR
jgi:hypothetical protein